MKDSYLTILNDIQNEIIIEKSRFITTVKRVTNDEEAKEFVSSIKSKYPDATHNCYAYVADENGFYVKFSDDGEPQGTAGMPMLEVLKNKKLFCTAVVVTRYFGGVKLGAGGLVRAYSESVTKCVDKAGIIEWENSNVLSVAVSFSIYPKIIKYFATLKCKTINTDFTDTGVNLTFAVPVNLTESVKTAFADFSSGRAEISLVENRYEYYGDSRL